jgi:hypothetical protein
MGKAARNERIKYRATYLNNTAAGVGVAGLFIPVLSFFSRGDDFDKLMIELTTGAVGVESVRLLGTLLATLFAFGISRVLHNSAVERLNALQDD